MMGITSDVFTMFIAGAILEKLGSKTSLLLCYLTAACGGIMMLVFGL